MAAKRRQTARAQAANDGDETGKIRLNVRIDSAAHERLMIHALKRRCQPGEVLVSLIEEHLRDWTIRANPGSRVVTDDRLGADGSVSSPAHLAL